MKVFIDKCANLFASGGIPKPKFATAESVDEMAARLARGDATADEIAAFHAASNTEEVDDHASDSASHMFEPLEIH